MEWNRELSGFIINFTMLTCVIALILKRKNLEEGINYFIAAMGIITLIEIFLLIYIHFNPNFNSSTIYIIGVNFFVFGLFFLYFHHVLNTRKLKQISLFIMGLFLLNYLFSALFIERFFLQFSLISYFIEVILLFGSINLVLSQIFNSDKILVLSTYFPFWICISLLVIYLGVLPLLIISETAEIVMNLQIFFAILFFVNMAGYLILIAGIIRAKKEV